MQSSVTFSLADSAHAISPIKNLLLTGTAPQRATGNALNNILTVNSGANVLAGLAGADIRKKTLRANKSETFDCRKFTLEGAGERSDGNARTSAHGLIFPA